MANDPISQFKLTEILSLQIAGVNLSFTQSAFFMVVTVAASCGFLMLATNGRGLIPSRAQSLAEICYEFVAGILRDSAGKEGMRFFPLIFSLFMFVLVANLLGMIPFFFTVTSHIIVTFALAMVVITTVIGYGIYRHGLKFLGLFAPSGIPAPLLILVTPIEIISFLSRPISLSVRLFANMLAGHITLKVFAGFVLQLSSSGFVGVIGAVAPLIMVIALTGLEFLVAFLQAYVFTILSCMYLHDAIHPNH